MSNSHTPRVSLLRVKQINRLLHTDSPIRGDLEAASLKIYNSQTIDSSTDPLQWSNEDVKAWLLWTLRQYSLPLVPVEYFTMDGSHLATLTEQDFIQRAPQVISRSDELIEFFFAQLSIFSAGR
jgi:hypothetical protein